MHLFSSAILLGAATLHSVFARPGLSDVHTIRPLVLKQSVEDFIQSETPIALERLLCNIGADGCHASGVSHGLVIASPSKEAPPYFYTWTRDSALVFKSLVDSFVNSYDADLQRRIMEYVAAQAHLQGLSNPSGDLSDGSGLGEPKFNVDESAYTDNWGRPQRDGPALRAIAIMSYGEWLIDNTYIDTARDIIWPIVRNDLNYVAEYWNHTGFDLWEEVEGSSFFTVANQHKALVQGSNFAGRIGQQGDHYKATSAALLCFLQDFWNADGGFVEANINSEHGRTGLDANTILASIHTFDPLLGCDGTTFQPCSDKALSNLKAVVGSFSFYEINSGIPNGTAIAIGRYPEDVYYEGNPWYLNTLAVAEQLYDAIYVWRQQGTISVTETSLGFFTDLVPDILIGKYEKGYGTFSAIVQAVSLYADGFVNVVATYAQEDGSLNEQFSRNDGRPLSAVDLTWSYASFLTTTARRAGVLPKPWAAEVEPVPDVCSAISYQGSYNTATVTIFPPSQTPIAGTTPPTTPTAIVPPDTSTSCDVPSEVTVIFEVRTVTQPGEVIKAVGDVERLGGWSPDAAVELDASDYRGNDPVWKGSVRLPADETIEYKYVRVQGGGQVQWESDPNRRYRIPRSCGTTVTRSDIWR